MKKVLVYDPTLKDKRSSVRGIGRYLQILKENFPGEFEFVSDLGSVRTDPCITFINPFFNFLQKPLTLKRIAKKQIAVIHDLIPLKYPDHFPAGIRGNINIFLNKFTLKNYDLIITVSEATKADIINILGVNENKIKVIYSCLPQSFLNLKIKNLDLNKNFKLKIENFCLYVGDATWNKNLVNMAHAIKIANVTCVLVGKIFDQLAKVASGEALREADCRDIRQSLAEEECHERLNLTHPWQKELKKFYELTKNDKRFIFAGFVPDSELIKLYERALFNILPSRDEGFGFSYLEAAQFSCPSLLSDIPVLKEISDEKALFADPNNPQDIAEKIMEISSNKNLRNKIGADAKKRSEFFSQEMFRNEFLKLIQS